LPLEAPVIKVVGARVIALQAKCSGGWLLQSMFQWWLTSTEINLKLASIDEETLLSSTNFDCVIGVTGLDLAQSLGASSCMVSYDDVRLTCIKDTEFGVEQGLINADW
jgi:hypothetical protein